MAEQIRGQVWFHVPYLGAIRDGLHGKGGITLSPCSCSPVTRSPRSAQACANATVAAHARSVELPLDRQLVIVTLEIDRLASREALTPEGAATIWSGLFVHRDDTTCTLVLATPAADLGRHLRMLGDLKPRELVVVEGAASITGQVTPRPLPITKDDHVDA